MPKIPDIRGNSLYTLITNPSSSDGPGWNKAETDSKKIGGNLVTINNSEENEWIHKTFNITSNPNSSLPSYYWTGFNDAQEEGNWVWSSGEKSTYTNWWGADWGIPPNPPPYPNPDENYMELGWVSNNRWNDRPNRDLNNIVGGISESKFIRRGDSAYVIVEGPTWEEAEANANTLGGNLVTINNEEENNFLVNSFKNANKGNWDEPINNDIYWIGLNRSNEGWNWISGNQLNFTNINLPKL